MSTSSVPSTSTLRPSRSQRPRPKHLDLTQTSISFLQVEQARWSASSVYSQLSIDLGPVDPLDNTQLSSHFSSDKEALDLAPRASRQTNVLQRNSAQSLASGASTVCSGGPPTPNAKLAAVEDRRPSFPATSDMQTILDAFQNQNEPSTDYFSVRRDSEQSMDANTWIDMCIPTLTLQAESAEEANRHRSPVHDTPFEYELDAVDDETELDHDAADDEAYRDALLLDLRLDLRTCPPFRPDNWPMDSPPARPESRMDPFLPAPQAPRVAPVKRTHSASPSMAGPLSAPLSPSKWPLQSRRPRPLSLFVRTTGARFAQPQSPLSGKFPLRVRQEEVQEPPTFYANPRVAPLPPLPATPPTPSTPLRSSSLANHGLSPKLENKAKAIDGLIGAAPRTSSIKAKALGLGPIFGRQRSSTNPPLPDVSMLEQIKRNLPPSPATAPLMSQRSRSRTDNVPVLLGDFMSDCTQDAMPALGALELRVKVHASHSPHR